MIEIDIGLITTFEMTIEEYSLLMLLYEKSFIKIRSYFTDSNKLQSLLERLMIQGFIYLLEFGEKDNLGDYKIHHLPSYSKEAIDHRVEELIKNYPKSVVRTDGTRDILTGNKERIKVLYKKMLGPTGNKDKHETILKTLQFQVEYFTNRGKLPYMRKLVNWLQQEEWKEYYELMVSDIDRITDTGKEDSKYGHNLL